MTIQFISGRHSTLSILNNPNRHIIKIYQQKNLPDSDILKAISKKAQARQITIKEVSRQTLEKKCSLSGKSHQGLVALCQPLPEKSLSDFKKWLSSQAPTPAPFILIADHIEDPHNLGALIRSAELAGCMAVVIPNKRAAQVTATVVKTSAGASELIPIFIVSNINQTITACQEKHLQVVGLETDQPHTIYQLDFKKPLALVIGNEHQGLAHLTRQKCNHLAHIPMHGQTASLNASNAGAIALFEVVRQRKT